MVAIESYVDPNSVSVIEKPSDGTAKQSAGPEQAVQSASGDMSGTLMATGVQASMEG